MELLYTRAPDIMMIAGHETIIPFEAKRTDGGDVDLSISNVVIKWILTDWNMPICPVLTLSNTDSEIVVGTPTSNFDVILRSEYTSDLYGEYNYQIEITSPTGDVFRPVEGNLIIKQRNYET